MDRRTLLAGALAAAVPGIAAAKAQRSAAEEVRVRLATATAAQKSLLILFYAQWCSWCRVFDRFLADPAAAAALERRLDILHMRAQEHAPEYKALQLDGADALYDRYAPEGAGLPFFVVLDANGRPRVNSIIPKTNENIGFPVSPEELDAFRAMLKRSTPAFTDAELAVIRAACVRHAPRRS